MTDAKNSVARMARSMGHMGEAIANGPSTMTRLTGRMSCLPLPKKRFRRVTSAFGWRVSHVDARMRDSERKRGRERGATKVTERGVELLMRVVNDGPLASRVMTGGVRLITGL